MITAMAITGRPGWNIFWVRNPTPMTAQRPKNPASIKDSMDPPIHFCEHMMNGNGQMKKRPKSRVIGAKAITTSIRYQAVAHITKGRRPKKPKDADSFIA